MRTARPVSVSWQGCLVVTAATAVYVAVAWLVTSDGRPVSPQVVTEVVLAASAVGTLGLVGGYMDAATWAMGWRKLARAGLGLAAMSAAAAIAIALHRFVEYTVVGMAILIVPAALYLAGIEVVVKAMSRRHA